jgi:S-formylglutathione hydrolase FrmB
VVGLRLGTVSAEKVEEMGLSLTHGWLPVLVTALAALALAGTTLRSDRHWWSRRVPLALAATAVITVAITALLRSSHLVADNYPKSFLLWGGSAIFAVVVATMGWAHAPAWRRWVSVGALPVTVLFAATMINEQYSYVPSLGVLLGQPRPGQVSSDRLLATLESTSTTRAVLTTSTNLVSGGSSSTHLTTVASAPPVSIIGPTGFRHGTVAEIDIPSPASGFPHRKGFVYLPPAYFDTPRPILPVVVMVAGVPGQPGNWLQAADADKTADAYAARHRGIAPILVMADNNGSFVNDTECVNSPFGQAETYLTVDVPAFITKTFGVAPDPSHWAVAGFSEGGTCANLLALRHPDVFGVSAAYSADPRPTLGSATDTLRRLFGGDPAARDAHDPVLILASTRFDHSAMWFSAGSREPSKLAAAKTLEAAARAAGVDTHLDATNGGHNFRAWTVAFRTSLPWLSQHLGLPA